MLTLLSSVCDFSRAMISHHSGFGSPKWINTLKYIYNSSSSYTFSSAVTSQLDRDKEDGKKRSGGWWCRHENGGEGSTIDGEDDNAGFTHRSSALTRKMERNVPGGWCFRHENGGEGSTIAGEEHNAGFTIRSGALTRKMERNDLVVGGAGVRMEERAHLSAVKEITLAYDKEDGKKSFGWLVLPAREWRRGLNDRR